MPLASSVEDIKDRMHDLLTDAHRSVLDSETGCYTWLGAADPQGNGKVKVMGVVLNVSRVAAWVYGCKGLPRGWDLFDPRIRVKAKCGNGRCINHEHIVPTANGRPSIAERWLRRQLQSGPQFASDIVARAKAAGFFTDGPFADGALKKAKRRLGVQSVWSGRRSLWLLPGKMKAA
jgi:hypothetical protein